MKKILGLVIVLIAFSGCSQSSISEPSPDIRVIRIPASAIDIEMYGLSPQNEPEEERLAKVTAI